MSAEPLTRQIGPGLFWLPDCLEFPYQGVTTHAHASTYLIVGDRTLLVDAGHPGHAAKIHEALTVLLGDRPLDYVFPTHPELPHAGNMPSLAARYRNLKIVGDTRDYALFFPQIADRLVPLPVGESVDLGGTMVTAIEPTLRDLPNTIWAYDHRSRALFVADAFGYAHHHQAGECALTSAELPEAPTPEHLRFLNYAALYWTRFVDLAPFMSRFDALVAEYPVDVIGPAHGAVIVNPDQMVPIIKEGFLEGQRVMQQDLRASS